MAHVGMVTNCFKELFKKVGLYGQLLEDHFSILNLQFGLLSLSIRS